MKAPSEEIYGKSMHVLLFWYNTGVPLTDRQTDGWVDC